MRKYLVFIACLFIIACSNLGSVRTVNGNKVEVIEDPQDLGSIAFVEYYDFTTLQQQENKRAELLFQKPDYTKLMKNGFVLANIVTPTLDSANTKYWVVVIKKSNGELVSTTKGQDILPSPKTLNGLTTWSNSLAVPLPENIQPPFDVFVISELHQKRWGARVLSK
ncbi:hypothetical protein G3479_07235 [Shewanella baltica]|uniref:hypothetical protein n=1 Tax=Shewanella baltica TaxID=62322 RepID=UPI00217D0E47|nr:hypothetical protein [Shewanella baltica]MCS6259047.1 hypothetical protein [Shewanella baltica]